MCGPCCYYKNALVIVPQVFSILAVLMSFGWWWPWLVGIIVMTMQQVLYCVKAKALIWVLVFLQLIPAALLFYAGYAIMNTEQSGFCWPIWTIQEMCDDGRLYFSINSYVGGGLWVISSVLDLVYVLITKDDEETTDEAVAVPVENV